MKIAVLTDKDQQNHTVSACFVQAQYIAIVDTTTKQIVEDQITPQKYPKGYDLVQRVNALQPAGLVMATGGPALRFLDVNIVQYSSGIGTGIDDIIDQFNQGTLQLFNLPPGSQKGVYGQGKGQGQGQGQGRGQGRGQGKKRNNP